jgi:RNA polymerase-binding protein DksA
MIDKIKTGDTFHKGSGNGLNKKDLSRLKAMLLEKRRSLLGDVDGLRAEISGNADVGNNMHHPDSEDDVAGFSSDSYELEMTVGLLASEREMLQEINEALGRMRNGTYGICEATGRPIRKARLEARPWARYCIEYAREMEGRRRIRA